MQVETTVPAPAPQALPAATIAAPQMVALQSTTPTITNPANDFADHISVVGHDAPTSSEAEGRLTSEILAIWSEHKGSRADVRRTRAEIKILRLSLAEKLHSLKAIFVGTGRGGGWAHYLRSQRIPLATADRYVAEHDATLAPPKAKLLNEELPTLTVDEIRHLAQKILPKVQRALSSQELVYEFVHELVWSIDVAEAWYTEKGLEIPKVESDDVPETDAPKSSDLAPAVP